MINYTLSYYNNNKIFSSCRYQSAAPVVYLLLNHPSSLPLPGQNNLFWLARKAEDKHAHPDHLTMIGRATFLLLLLLFTF